MRTKRQETRGKESKSNLIDTTASTMEDTGEIQQLLVELKESVTDQIKNFRADAEHDVKKIMNQMKIL